MKKLVWINLFAILLIGTGLAFQNSVHAAGKKRITSKGKAKSSLKAIERENGKLLDTEYSDLEKSLIEIRNKYKDFESVSTSLDAQLQSHSTFIEKNSTFLEDQEKKLEKARAELAAAEEAIDEAQARGEVIKARDRNRLVKAKSNLEKAVSDTEALIQARQESLVSVGSQIEDSQSAWDATRRSFSDPRFRQLGSHQDILEEIRRETGKSSIAELSKKEINSYLDKQRMSDEIRLTIQQAKDTFSELFDNQMRNKFDSKLLLMSFDKLKEELKGSEEALEGAKQALDGQLNNSLMGQYVNDQITKGLSNVCELQKACAARESGNLSNMIHELLDNKRGSQLELQIENEQLKGYKVGDGPTGEDMPFRPVKSAPKKGTGAQ